MSEYEEEVIEIIEDGPYIAYNIKLMIDQDGNKIDTSPRMVLCRCGHSDDKPFCDGTHTEIGFNDDKKEDRVPDKVVAYKGDNITIYDNRGVCSHIGYCTGLLPEVFDKSSFKWIEPNAADAKDIIKICELCPSGALSYSLPGGERIQKPVQHKKKIKVSPDPYRNNGPYDVMGGIKLISKEGYRPECEEHYSLCRCGSSKNMPFCDGSHRDQVEFNDNE